MNIKYKFVDKGLLSEEDVANIIFNEIISRKFITKYDMSNEDIKIPLIRNFKDRIPRNMGVEMEALTMYYLVNNEGHIPLTDITLERPDLGYDIVSFNKKIIVTEVKSLIRKSQAQKEQIEQLIKESFKSNFCTKKQNAFQWLDSIKIAENNNITSKPNVLSLLKEVNGSLNPKEKIINKFKENIIEMKSSIILTSNMDLEIIQEVITNTFENKVYFDNKECPFCDKEECLTPKKLNETTIVYEVMYYKINKQMDQEKYYIKMEELISGY